MQERGNNRRLTFAGWWRAASCGSGARRIVLYGAVVLLGFLSEAAQGQLLPYYPAGLPGGAGGVLRLWLDAADTATIMRSGTAVDVWRDKSGYAHDCAQADTSRRPRFDAGALGVGMPGIACGAGRGVVVADDTALSPSMMTVLSVVSIPDQTRAYRFVGKAQSQSGSYALACDAGATLRFTVDAGQGFQHALDSGGITAQSTHAVFGTANSSAVSLFGSASMSARDVVPVASAPVDQDDDTEIGDPTGSREGGNIGEVLLFGKVLSLTEQALLMNHLRTKWGVAIDNAVAWYYSTTHRHDMLGLARLGNSDYVAGSASSSGGLLLSTTATKGGFLRDDGDALLAAHDGALNSVVPLSGGSMLSARWSRSWCLQKTDAPGTSGGAVTLSFHFPTYHGAAWSAPVDTATYVLLYHPTDAAFGSGHVVIAASASVTATYVSFTVNANQLATGYYTLAAEHGGALCSGTIAGNGVVLGACLGDVSVLAGAAATLEDSSAVIGSLTMHDGAALTLAAGSRLYVRGRIVMRGGAINGAGTTMYEAGAMLLYAGSEQSSMLWTSGELPVTQAPGLVRISTRDTVMLTTSTTINNLLFDSTGSTLDLGTSQLVLRTSLRGPGLVRSRRGRLLLQASAPASASVGWTSVETMEIDMPAGVSCNGTLTILDTLRLHAGDVRTGVHSVVFDEDAVILGETHARRIDGRVQSTRRIDRSQSDFGGLGLVLDAGSDSLGLVALVRQSGSPITYMGSESIRRWWRITPERQPSSGITVGVTWRLAEMNGVDPQRLQPWRSTDAGVNWQKLAGGDLIATVADSLASVTFVTPGFSDFTLTDANNPLPVELVSFTAQWRNGEVALRWVTETESNSASFVLERAAGDDRRDQAPASGGDGSFGADEQRWSIVTVLPAAGNSNVPRVYVAKDADPSLPNNPCVYYRLRQLDRDGSVHVYPALEVRLPSMPATAVGIHVTPIPVVGELTVRIDTPADGALAVTVFDLLGRTVATVARLGYAAAGSHVLRHSVGDIPTGIYFLNVEASGQSTIRPISVIRR